MPVTHDTTELPTVRDVQDAAHRIKPFVHRTPVLRSRSLDAATGCDVLLKCENLQRVGAFKIRGATNAIAMLSDDEKLRGVITHSSGNHAQAVALAARNFGVRATVVMPSNTSPVKAEAARGYGAEVVFCEPTQDARERVTQELIDQFGAALIHPYNDAGIIAGQGTAALELIEEAGPMDVIYVPISGGGLTAGTALACSGSESASQVVAVEPDGADDAYRSLQTGQLIKIDRPTTIADGLRAQLGPLPFAVMQEHNVEVLCVSDAQIIDAMQFIWERAKLVIEPSAATAVAGLLYRDHERWYGRRVGVVLSGGNVDARSLFEALRQSG